MTSDAAFQSIPERKCDPLTFYTIAPKNARIAIYGAGKAGELLLAFIRKFRKDISVLYYLDSFQSGTKDGLPVVKVDSPREHGDIDFIVICSAMYREIEGILKFFGEIRYVVVSQKPKYSSRYYARNRENFEGARDMLHAESDRNLYKLLLDYSRDHELMLSHPDTFVEKLQAFDNGLWYLDHVNTDVVRTAVDGGAFNGDTAEHFLKHFKNLKTLHCFDVSFTRDQFFDMNKHRVGDKRICFHEMGLSDKKDTQYIIENAYQPHDAGVSISRDAVFNRAIPCTSLDVFSEDNDVKQIDYVKMDIEGAEFEALNGCRGVIKRFRPQLAICIYHEYDDMWSVPLLLKKLCDDYVFRLSHYSPCLIETVIYAIPRELYQGE